MQAIIDVAQFQNQVNQMQKIEVPENVNKSMENIDVNQDYDSDQEQQEKEYKQTQNGDTIIISTEQSIINGIVFCLIHFSVNR